MLALAITLICSGLITTLICLPMIYGRVLPNALYGIRTRHTFESSEAWMDLNEVGGMLFSLLGFPLVLGGTIGLFLSDTHIALVGIATTAGCILSLGFTVYLFLRYSARYTARNFSKTSSKAHSVG